MKVPDDLMNLFAPPAWKRDVVEEAGHRPWPPPERPWLMAQSWNDLLFAHWPVSPDALEGLVPPSLSVDTFEGDAWMGMTPFALSGLRLRMAPPLPRLSSFLELNVRTYVTAGGKPGVLFFSLDASNALAVRAARVLYKLPYFRARMSRKKTGDWIEYSSERDDRGSSAAALKVRYAGEGPLFQASPGSLENFLVERYCLYTVDRRDRLLRGEIHHPPWALQAARAEIELNTMAPPGIELPPREPLLHFAQPQDVVVWAPEWVL